MNRPVPVVHLITTLDTGGTETMLSRLLAFMDRRRFSNHVICLTRMGDLGEKIRARGIPVHAMDMPRGKITLTGLARLVRVLSRVRPRILQTWLYHADLMGLVFGRLTGVRSICWNVRCSYISLEDYHASTKWTLRACALLSRVPSLILTNSHEARAFHIRLGYRATGWKVIPNGFDLDEFKPDPSARPWLLRELGVREEGPARSEGDPQTPFLIGFIARFDPMKDHPSFLQAACRILEQGRNAHFVLAGRGVSRENPALSQWVPARWKDRFHFLGRRHDIERITAGLSIASLASRGEGFPNVVCEAMACGVPCVVMDVGDSASIVGDTGVVVPPGRPEALAKAWSSVMGMEREALDLLGRAARERVLMQFEIRHIAEAYESLYLSLGSKTGRRFRGRK